MNAHLALSKGKMKTNLSNPQFSTEEPYVRNMINNDSQFQFS